MRRKGRPDLVTAHRCAIAARLHANLEPDAHLAALAHGFIRRVTVGDYQLAIYVR